ncbi:hypothetical protein CN231_25340 [Sinorhizobium meliloti]|nr:hypothetical protein [Sinorhizobium meliloti]MQX25070.1 hypothetical protein [Sinorhizobium meliloti]RMC67784.1 hypothetical protein EBB04_12505 [Sinorhizobium meliloti]RVG10036.1 hypothetical protein CN231_25340 [Sinorhizobium meliloti]RVI64012.1 hypothetical protein CN189_14700 [Sinorhizobium meliloti]
MRGYLLLTEARSGSNWLGSLVNGAGNMGRSSEWLSPKIHRLDTGALSWDAFFQELLRKCSTPNGVFGSKIFPNQLFVTHEVYGRDFIQHCLAMHDVALVFLRRRDTLRQAISYARASKHVVLPLTSREGPIPNTTSSRSPDAFSTFATAMPSGKAIWNSPALNLPYSSTRSSPPIRFHSSATWRSTCRCRYRRSCRHQWQSSATI